MSRTVSCQPVRCAASGQSTAWTILARSRDPLCHVGAVALHANPGGAASASGLSGFDELHATRHAMTIPHAHDIARR